MEIFNSSFGSARPGQTRLSTQENALPRNKSSRNLEVSAFDEFRNFREDPERSMVALRPMSNTMKDGYHHMTTPVIHNTITESEYPAAERPAALQQPRQGINWEDAQNIWTPSTKHDMTMHFEMEIVDDIESRIEEFSKLKRLGDFRTAEQFYRDFLEPLSDTYVIANEYADMLIEQGAYEKLNQYMRTKQGLFNKAPVFNSYYPRSEADILRANLLLMAALSAAKTRNELKEAYEKVISMYANLPKELDTNMLSSSELQIALSALKILSLTGHETNLLYELKINSLSKCCYNMYKKLVVHDRIWDARDMIVGMVAINGPTHAWRRIFDADIYSRDAFSRILEDWNMQQYDESTYLAILDVLISVARALCSLAASEPNESGLQAADQCLQSARGIADCLKGNNQDLMKSRSYMRLVLVEEELRRKVASGDPLCSHLGTFPGLAGWTGLTPIYVPLKQENPMWCPAKDQAGIHSSTMLESTLQAAHEQEDYATEALLLGEMIVRASEAPIERYKQLSHLQKNIQGDTLGYRQTCLSKFLVAQTDHARKELLDELIVLRTSLEAGFKFSLSDWCAFRIEKTLCDSLGNSFTDLRADREPSFSSHIPQSIKDTIVNLGLGNIYGLEFKPKFGGRGRRVYPESPESPESGEHTDWDSYSSGYPLLAPHMPKVPPPHLVREASNVIIREPSSHDRRPVRFAELHSDGETYQPFQSPDTANSKPQERSRSGPPQEEEEVDDNEEEEEEEAISPKLQNSAKIVTLEDLGPD
ncbi:uncharacterized protein N7511_008127 [Penicillium nucicola]|uniref:uncharacterized protein n=1 Tax=Penicillium nucicola TaxID=1850975 RepID=UPI0025450D0A|nr:uncharacterized protein N7511_008127 [Penicillium nucicola]KAJ5753974.1 hypothetical protein N7511_008127 [Penicillium nucicola]